MDGVMIIDHGTSVDYHDVVFLNPDAKQSGLRALLAAADAEGSTVALRTGGTHRAFRVTRTVVAAAGLLFTDDVDEDSTDTVDEPPRTGKGSSKDAWHEFLNAQGVDVPELGATRDQLIALWDEHQRES